MENQNQQELIFKLSMFEQQMQQLQQQLQAVEQSLAEISSLNRGIDSLKESEGKEIFAPLGRGIFINAKILSENLTVDIGEKNFVKKSIPETKKLIEGQIKKLEDIRKNLVNSMNRLGEEMQQIVMEAQNMESEKN